MTQEPSESTKTPRQRWTIEALKEYFDMRFNDLECRMIERSTSQDLAVRTAMAANEKRLDGMNQIREQLKEQAATFVTRIEFDSLEKLINDKLDSLSQELKDIQISDAVLAGKASTWQVVIAWILALGSILSRFIK